MNNPFSVETQIKKQAQLYQNPARLLRSIKLLNFVSLLIGGPFFVGALIYSFWDPSYDSLRWLIYSVVMLFAVGIPLQINIAMHILSQKVQDGSNKK